MVSFYNKPSPVVSLDWKKKSNKQRIDLISLLIINNSIFQIFQVMKTYDDGKIIIKINKNLTASDRGDLLMDLEEFLKKNVDNAVTVWCEPIEDKNKLRLLRGIKVKN